MTAQKIMSCLKSTEFKVTRRGFKDQEHQKDSFENLLWENVRLENTYSPNQLKDSMTPKFINMSSFKHD